MAVASFAEKASAAARGASLTAVTVMPTVATFDTAAPSLAL